MRALFITSPGLSHMFPTIPLAHALRAAGHDVRYATGGHVHGVSDAGLHVMDVSPGVNYAKLFVPDDGDDSDPMHAADPGMRQYATMFGRVSSVVVDGALDFARWWSPDLIVGTPTSGAAPLVAAALGLPYAEVPLGPTDSFPGLPAAIRAAMADDYERHDVTGDPAVTVRINTIPPSLEEHLPGGRSKDDWRMRYVPYNGGGVLPDWLPQLSRPRIAITLGSIDGFGEGITRLKPLLGAVGGMDVEFVLTIGGGDLSLLGELPDNVRAEEWIPLAALLDTCEAIIHHGGSGTMLAAAAAGIPQCVLPHGDYQDASGEAIVGRGIGFSADPTSVGAAECDRLLKDEALRNAAHEVRDELRSMPAPVELVPRLVELIG